MGSLKCNTVNIVVCIVGARVFALSQHCRCFVKAPQPIETKQPDRDETISKKKLLAFDWHILMVLYARCWCLHPHHNFHLYENSSRMRIATRASIEMWNVRRWTKHNRRNVMQTKYGSKIYQTNVIQQTESTPNRDDSGEIGVIILNGRMEIDTKMRRGGSEVRIYFVWKRNYRESLHSV